MAQKDYNFKHALYFSIVVIALSLAITVAVMPTGVEHNLASSLYNKADKLSWLLRQHGAAPVMVITLLSLIFIMVPPLRRKSALLRTMASTWIATFAIAGGILCSFIAKEYIERPRPRDTVLTVGTLPADMSVKGGTAEIVGKSFVSGHTAAAAMMIVPAFALWAFGRRKSALFVFTAGTAYAALIAYSRMVLGAHFLTDNLWAYTFIACGAAYFTALFMKHSLNNKVMIPALILAAFSMVYFNDFRIKTALITEGPENTLSLTCADISVRANGVHTRIIASIEGAGAPISNIHLTDKNGTVHLKTFPGLFRGITCTKADILLKEGESLWLPYQPTAQIKPHIDTGEYVNLELHGDMMVFSVPQNVSETGNTPTHPKSLKAQNK